MKGKQDKTFNRARTKSAAGDLFKFSKKKIWALEFRQWHFNQGKSGRPD